MDSVTSKNKLFKRNHFSSDSTEYFIEMQFDSCTTVLMHMDKKQFENLFAIIPAYHDNTTPEGREVKKIESLNG